MPEKVKGRPPFKPTLAQSSTVEQMRYCGESIAVIARAIGIDEDTLKKHFPEQLADGHAKRRREVVGYLFSAAKKGNVTAQKKLEEMGRGIDRLRDAPSRVETDEGTERHLGKKAAAQADADAAVAAGGKFAPRTTPRLASVDGRPLSEAG